MTETATEDGCYTKLELVRFPFLEYMDSVVKRICEFTRRWLDL